jgi:CDP-L-myo-inositol myo-inositolphosphotransferase
LGKTGIKALILAAGRGSRLNHLTKGTPKPLTQIVGLSLIERAILTAKQAGIDEFVIVVGYQGDMIKASLEDGEKLGVKIVYVENEEWLKGNGVSALKAKRLFERDFLLLMADHVFDVRILKELLKTELEASVTLAIDRRKPLLGDTKVLEKNGRIVNIGKNIENSNCIDTGIFLCSPKLFTYAEATVEAGKTELADCIAKAARKGDAAIFDISQIGGYLSKMRKAVKPWWIDVDTEEDLRRAEETIIENASKNPSDALAYYVNKPIENKLVAYISNYNITPNQLSIVVNILAYIVTALFFFGHLLSASILSFVVGIADGLDGKLARVKIMTSKLGLMEHPFDLLFEFSWFIALSLHLYIATASSLPLILCIFIMLFIAFYRHVYDQFGRAMGQSLDDYGGFERSFRRIAGRRNLYNIPILVSVLLGAPQYSLLFIAFHSGITAIVYSSRAIKHLLK